MAVKFFEFNLDKDSWKNYIERFDFCLLANAISSDDLKKANFVSVCGHTLYDLILSLISPKQIHDVTYSQIKILLSEHFNPKQNEIVQSYKFHMCNQLMSENVKDYVANIRKLAIDCNFSDLDRTLRDRFVCGVRDRNIQKQLLQQSSLTFEQAIKLAQAIETADAGVLVMSVSGSSAQPLVVAEQNCGEEPMEVNKLKEKTYPQNRKECWRCGKVHGQVCFVF